MFKKSKIAVAVVLLLVAAFAFINFQHIDPPGSVPPAATVSQPPQMAPAPTPIIPAPLPAPMIAAQTPQEDLGPDKPGGAIMVSDIPQPQPAARVSLEDDIESPDYVFKPVRGVEYKSIWYRVPQQDLKYIRL